MILVPAAAWAALLRPVALGGSVSYIAVVGNSMHPTLAPGTFALATREQTYVRGDIVVFRIPEAAPARAAGSSTGSSADPRAQA